MNKHKKEINGSKKREGGKKDKIVSRSTKGDKEIGLRTEIEEDPEQNDIIYECPSVRTGSVIIGSPPLGYRHTLRPIVAPRHCGGKIV